MSRRTAVAAAAIVVLLALSLGYAAETGLIRLNGGSTSTTESGNYAYKSVADSVSGLQVNLSLNASSLRSGGPLSMAVNEYNPTGSPVNLSAADNWKARNVGIGFGCAFENLPIMASVFQGYYTADNLSQATPLQVVDVTGVKYCPPVWTVHSWVFQPTSSTAVLEGCLGSSCYTSGTEFSISQVFVLTGTWTSAGGSASLSPFVPGAYTVVAGDEWGALAILHFTVTSA